MNKSNRSLWACGGRIRKSVCEAERKNTEDGNCNRVIIIIMKSSRERTKLEIRLKSSPGFDDFFLIKKASDARHIAEASLA